MPDPSPSHTPDQTPTPTGPPTDTPLPTQTDESPSATPTTSIASTSPASTSTQSPSAPPLSSSPTPTVTVVERPASSPAVSTSTIPLASVLLAVVVLVAAVGLVLAIARRAGRSGARTQAAAPTADGSTSGPTYREAAAVQDSSDAAVVPFLLSLGQAMTDSGAAVTHIRDTLERVAVANGLSDAEIVVLPTALIISVARHAATETAVVVVGETALRLDQITAVFEVAATAELGEIAPADGSTALQQALRQAAPFGPAARVFGYAVLSVGLALILSGSWLDLAVSAALGASVAALQLRTDQIPAPYRGFIAVLSALVVSVVVFLLARTTWDVRVLPALVSPLVTFLPGALLTTSVIELATGQMISGAGRLAAGAMRLVLLALGIVAGAQLVGVPASLMASTASAPLGPVAPWLGVAIFGIGVIVNSCARPSSTGWILLVLYVAYAGQVLGGLLFGAVLSAFVGALLMTPVAMFAATQRSGPPTLVSFLPGFWLLVPGALGLVGVTTYLGAERGDGAAILIDTGMTMVAIALGVLLGLALGSGIASLIPRTRTSGRTQARQDQ